MEIKELDDIPKEMMKRLKLAKDMVLNVPNIQRIISHYDADGICAAGILCSALLREGLKFHVTLTKSLSEEFIDVLAKDEYPNTIFCDMGSSQLEPLSNLKGNVIILDHHMALSDSKEPLLINTNAHKIPGTDEMCASSLAFLFSIVLNENNWDLAALALAGCIGDKQHLNGFLGFNAFMVKRAQELDIIEPKDTVKLDTGMIKKSLFEGLDPFIKGMSGREEKVSEFLNNLNLDPEIKVEDLDDGQMRILSSAIIVKLLAQGTRVERAEDFITTKYWLPSWTLYATDLSNYINSAGRMDEAGEGLALSMGDEDALKLSIELRKEYKDELREGMIKLEEDGLEDMKNLQFFYTNNASLAGAHAGLGMMYLFDQEKPVIALSVLDTETRISSRGTKYLVDCGLDLAAALRDAAKDVGGHGGGHPVASGATIPKGKEEKFLELVNEIVGKQFHKKRDK
jgi:single-stranded DNA-specific DHH superfamily exonuclease